MKPAAGTLVTRNVKLVRPLGRGGMGSVWVGRHESLDTEVAVKFISPEHAEKERFVARFRREASSAAKIKSPHVVQVFDHGVTDGGVPYIVMELLEGEPLAKRLRRGPLGPREMAMLVGQVCKVLSIAHDLGIVHRDLKPDNLFLVESGYELFVKVLDFGIAKQLVGELNEITDTGAMVGTPYYMSPEMLLSPKDADHRADLWALAVVAYHALTGELPFRGETLAALSVAINDGSFKPPSALVDNLGPEIDVWFKLALCRKIDGRFQTAPELSQRLRQALLDSLDTSGDRASQPISDDVLPETARPSTSGSRSSRALTVAATTGRAPGAEAEGQSGTGASGQTGTGMSPVELSAADRTVTSEQLARIRGDGSVSGDEDTVAAAADPSHETAAQSAQSTLEGTASEGDVPGGAWRRPASVVAAALFGVAAWLAIRPTAPPTSEPANAPAPTLSGERTSPPAMSHPTESRPPPSAAPVAVSASADSNPPPPASTSGRATGRPAGAPPPPMHTPRAPSPPKNSSRPKAKCSNPFYVDEHGDLQPRPGCF